MKRGHITDMPHCWCNPTKIGHSNGVIHIIHNEPENTMKEEQEQIEKVTAELVEELKRIAGDGKGGFIITNNDDMSIIHRCLAAWIVHKINSSK